MVVVGDIEQIRKENVIRIISVNIRSGRSNFDEFLTLLNSTKIMFNILVLTEIWIGEGETDLYEINDYVQYRKCRLSNKSGGTLIYTHMNSGFRRAHIEMRTAESIAVWNPDRKIFIIGVYRSHCFSVIEFCDELELILSGFTYKNLYIISDININIGPDARCCSDYLALMASFGLQRGITSETRFFKDNSA